MEALKAHGFFREHGYSSKWGHLSNEKSPLPAKASLSSRPNLRDGEVGMPNDVDFPSHFIPIDQLASVLFSRKILGYSAHQSISTHRAERDGIAWLFDQRCHLRRAYFCLHHYVDNGAPLSVPRHPSVVNVG